MRTVPLLTLSALFAASAPGQRLVAYDAAAPGMFETQPPSPFEPIPSPSMPVYPPNPPLAVMPGAGAAVGGLTYDGRAGLLWYSNGNQLAAMASPSVPTPAVPPPPMAIAPAVLAAIGGAATGIAMDPAAAILWITAATGTVVGVRPTPGTPVVVAPFAPAFAMNPVSGLDWDSLTGTLLSVDTSGNVYRYFPGGAAAGAVIAPPVALVGGVASGVAIDKSGIPNAAGVRPLFVASGGGAIDVRLPAPAAFPVVGNGPTGIAFLPTPASVPFFGSCGCGVRAFTLSASGPMTAGNAAFRLDTAGAMPGAFVLYALDFAYNPAFPLWNTTGCGSGVILGSPSLSTGFAFADGFGNASYALPLLVPAGAGPLYVQAFTGCPLDPAGYVVSPMMQLAACGL